MKFNLVDSLSDTTTRRFHLPLCSDSTGGESIPQVNPALFKVTEEFPNDMVCLNILIKEPSNGWNDLSGTTAEGVHPAIRLHAMASGRLRYEPNYGIQGSTLVLEIIPTYWSSISLKVPWIKRWIEADCIPHKIYYENVDHTQLASLLNSLDPDNPEANGLRFPVGYYVDQMPKEEFISAFLSGNPDYYFLVKPGTYIGCAADDLLGPPDHQLRLHARYQVKEGSPPRSMNPRELFNLFFGLDSRETKLHPLLIQLEQTAQNDTETFPETRRMHPRPPLRTHGRVVWEAELELKSPDDWKVGAELNEGKFHNTIADFPRHFTYKDRFKCTLFAFEILLRSGFRVLMIRNDYGAGHMPRREAFYFRVNWAVALARKTNLMPDRVTKLGSSSGTVWGRRWDAVLLKKFANDSFAQSEEINRLMQEEGRSFYLLDEFQAPSRSGHIQLLEKVEMTGLPNAIPIPLSWEVVGLDSGPKIGLFHIYATVLEAPKSGARRLTGIHTPTWPKFAHEDDKAAASINNDLLLIEAFPGKDPDTAEGIEDLCVFFARQNT